MEHSDIIIYFPHVFTCEKYRFITFYNHNDGTYSFLPVGEMFVGAKYSLADLQVGYGEWRVSHIDTNLSYEEKEKYFEDRRPK